MSPPNDFDIFMHRADSWNVNANALNDEINHETSFLQREWRANVLKNVDGVTAIRLYSRATVDQEIARCRDLDHAMAIGSIQDFITGHDNEPLTLLRIDQAESSDEAIKEIVAIVAKHVCCDIDNANTPFVLSQFMERRLNYIRSLITG